VFEGGIFVFALSFYLKWIMS